MSGGIFKNINNLRRPFFSLATSFKNHLRNNHSLPTYRYNMNEAYLRYENGDETFKFTFRYIDLELNIDRQFNLERKFSETVATFLKRLDGNLEKILAKKKKKKVKKTKEAVEEASKEDNVENGNIMLMRNNEKINLEESCHTLVENESEIVLQIFETPYKMRHNVPWVTSMSLPESILSGFPIYPMEFETLNTDRNKSKFVWYINRSEATHNSLVYKSSWEEICQDFVYTPTLADINCRLKLECTPVRDNESGPTIEVESKTRIEAGPGECPFEIRHFFTHEKLQGRNFRVTSYNILADVYASTEYSKNVLFPYCPPYALAIDYRKQLIIKELIGYNSDVICLQEVDSKIFEADLQPTLSLLHYDGVFNRKGDDLSEGIATFYDERRFEKLRSESRVMSHNVYYAGFSNIWKSIDNEMVKDRFLGRNTTVQVTVLRSRDNPREILVVGNTHLYFQPDADHIRLLQGYYTLTYCQDIARETRETYKDQANVSVLICGDFNSTPDCGIYQLMTKNHIPESHKDWSSNNEQIVRNISLSHDSSIASACGTPQYTNFTVVFADCLDYIFYETKSLEVVQVVPLPSKEELSLHSAIPSIVFPSDHVALCADLKWKI